MSSNERLILIGKKKELEDSKEKIIIKLKGFSKLLIEHSSTLLIDDLKQMDDKSIKVYSEELVKLIKELRIVDKDLSKITELLGDEE